MSRKTTHGIVSKHAQAGSAASVVLLVVVAVLLWWQWDWISGFVGSGGGSAVVEVVDYRCERQSDGRAAIEGRIRNTSKAAAGFRVVTAIYDSSGKKSDYRESSVRLLQPGQDGSFRGDGPALPDGGYCKLDAILDSETGKSVRRTGKHS